MGLTLAKPEEIIAALIDKTKDGSIEWVATNGGWDAKIGSRCNCRLRQGGRLTFNIITGEETESGSVESGYGRELVPVVSDRVKLPEELTNEYKQALFLECIDKQ